MGIADPELDVAVAAMVAEGARFVVVGASAVSDRVRRRSHEVDLVAMRGGRIAALGEAKLRTLGASDLDRLLRIRDLLDAPDAAIVLASVAGVDPSLRTRPDLIAIEPADVYA